MKGNLTFTIIKPDAVALGYTTEILNRISQEGFSIVALKMIQLSSEDAKRFYKIHEDKPFYKSLVTFMSSGPIVAAVLKKDNAVEDFRKLIGATNPQEAQENTIRKLYAKSTEHNAIHGSDSDENALMESLFYFSSREIFSFIDNKKLQHLLE